MDMKVKHVEKKVTDITVDVPVLDFLEKVYLQAQKNAPANEPYLKDGYWYVASGFDYHKSDVIYEKGRKAMTWEIELFEAYNLLKCRWKETQE